MKDGSLASSLPLLTGAILAGGRGRRLGRDKALATLGGRPLARWVADALAPVVSDLWLVTNQPLVHLELGLPLLTDLVPSQGPLGGLLTVLSLSRTSWVLAASVDSPFLSPPLLAALAARAARTGRPAVVCRTAAGLEPFPGVYAVRLVASLAEYLKNDHRLRPFVEKVRPEVISAVETAALDPEGLSFVNLNTPEDLAWAEARLGRPATGEAP